MRIKFLAVIALTLFILGCATTEEKVLEKTTPEKQKFEKKLEVSLPEHPYISLPKQIVFVEKTSVNVNSTGDAFVLYNPSLNSLNVDLEGNEIKISGYGKGEIIVGAKKGISTFYTKFWAVGLKKGFAIVPLTNVTFGRVGEEIRFKFKIVPIGNFSEKVRLKVKSSNFVKATLNPTSGKPPFEVDVKLKVNSAGDGQFVKIIGYSESSSSESYILINNPVREEKGLFSFFLNIFYVLTLPIRIATGITLGAISGITMSSVLLANPITFLSPELTFKAISSGIVVGKEVTKSFIESPFQGTIFSEGKVSGVGRVAVGDKNFKVVLPDVEFDAIIGKTYTLPVFVAGSGKVRLEVKSPKEVEAEISPKEGFAPFKAELKFKAKTEARKRGIIFKKIVPYVVQINASSEEGTEVYKLYIKPLRKDYDVTLSSNTVFVKKGSFTTIELFVVKNNELAPDTYTLKISPPQGFDVFAEKMSGETPFKMNVTFFAKKVEEGVYYAKIGDETLKIVVGEDIFVQTQRISVTQGGYGEGRIYIYSLKPVEEELVVKLGINNSLKKVNNYEYILQLSPSKYQPPGTYKATAFLGKEFEFIVEVLGVPVVAEYEERLELKKGESKDIKISLKSAGYTGEIKLKFTGSEGVIIQPEAVGSVPGEVFIKVSAEKSGTVNFSGKVNYKGKLYTISGSIFILVR